MLLFITEQVIRDISQFPSFNASLKHKMQISRPHFVVDVIVYDLIINLPSGHLNSDYMRQPQLSFTQQ